MPDAYSGALAGLPLRFNPPPGWATPSARWIAESQGIPIHPGWRPRPSYAPAPADWQFWLPNGPAWDAYAAPTYSRLTRQAWLGAGIAAIGLIIFLTGLATTPDGAFGVIFWGAILWGGIICIRAIVARSAVPAHLMAHLSVTSAAARKAQIDAEYSAYLASLR